MSSLKRIVIHHTGGSYRPSVHDKQCYHYLIDDVGNIIKGNFSPQANISCVDGEYAPHIKMFNTGSIGVACCGNFNYDIKNRSNSTKYPLTQPQLESMCSVIAHLCHTFDIKVNEATVFTHYQYDNKYKYNPDIYEGKTDITFIPYCPNLSVKNVGSYLRAKVKWYYDKYERTHYEKKTNVEKVKRLS